MTASRGAQRVGEVLVKAGLLDAMQLKSVLHHVEQWGGRVPKAAAELGLADEEDMARALCEAMALKFLPLGKVPRDGAAMKLYDATFCEKHMVFPVRLENRVLTLAVADPTDVVSLDEARAKAPGRVNVVLATETGILHAIERHYHGREPRIVSNKARKAVTRDEPMEMVGGLELDRAPPPSTGESMEPGRMLEFKDDSSDAEDAAPDPGWTADQLGRLETLRQNQAKAGLILDALKALLLEKGWLR